MPVLRSDQRRALVGRVVLLANPTTAVLFRSRPPLLSARESGRIARTQLCRPARASVGRPLGIAECGRVLTGQLRRDAAPGRANTKALARSAISQGQDIERRRRKRGHGKLRTDARTLAGRCGAAEWGPRLPADVRGRLSRPQPQPAQHGAFGSSRSSRSRSSPRRSRAAASAPSGRREASATSAAASGSSSSRCC